MRGLFAALAVLSLARSAYAQEADESIQAVRISGQQWSALDAAQTRGGLDSYQYSLGVVPLPEPKDGVREPIPSEKLVNADVLLVEASPEAISALRDGKPLREVLASVLGGEGAVVTAAGPLEDEPKPTEHQIALVLPAGALKASFIPGQEVSADRLLALGAELVLDVRPESPCEEKCNLDTRPVQVEPKLIDDPASLPPPELVMLGVPPAAGPAPLIRVGGPNLVQETDEAGGIRFHAEAGGSGDIYRWILTSTSGETWFLGDTTQARAVDFTLPRANLEASYQVQTLVYSWDASQARYATLQQKPYPPYYPPPPPPPPKYYDVGVIPNAAGCPSGVSTVTIYMDDEDKRNANSHWGWNGGITSNSNTTLRFCKVDGNKFKPLSTSNIINNHYAVLKLGNTCPNGSVDFTRHFDNEDKNNANWSSGPIYYNVSDRNTTLRFCLFRAGSTTMSAMPDLGFSYGVFAASNFSRAVQTGGFHTDDEDSNNANYYIDVVGGAMGDINRIINDTGNTNVNLARVKW